MASASAAVVGLALFTAAPASTVAVAKTSNPVYFFGDNSQPVGSHNPLVIRPKGFLLFLDGQWVLQHLHWTGWGSSVARATGISNSSNDIPDAASGKRIKTWADMTLSYPVRWRGHQVYSCFKILVPPPASDLSGCVLPQPPAGNGWPLGGNAGQLEFLAPGQNIWCAIGPQPSFCVSGAPDTSVGPSLGAALYPTGKVTLCSVPQASRKTSGGCTQNWDASPPVLKIGQKVRADNVLCTSARRGIVCTIASGRRKGKGFLISNKVVRKLG